jgi:methionyl-tRNA synthetase
MTDASVFVSSSIPYVNGPPHVGFAWELVLADVLARYHRAAGRRVWFSTGTDDNSLKNVRAAGAASTDVAAFVRTRGERFVALCGALGLSNDDFIRTAFDPRHAPTVEHVWRACAARGDVYRSSYRGAYCVGCEQFFAPHELPDGRCPEHDSALEHIDEANYFFHLARHQAGVAQLLSSGALRVHPDVYRAETQAWLDAGLTDFSISRGTPRARGWGIPVPGDDAQTVYVWFDALVNYLATLAVGGDPASGLQRWSECERRIHVVGKNVTRFHNVYWPAILASAGLPPPSDVVVHGFLTVDGRKIGKSLGNGVDPFALLERFGAERLRHYLLRRFPLGRDGDVSVAALVQCSNEELADQLGNLQNRLLVLLEQNTAGLVPPLSSAAGTSSALSAEARRLTERARAELERGDPHQGISHAFALVRACNLELARTEPWALARASREARGAEREALERRLCDALGDAARGLLWAAALLAPFLPGTAARVAAALGAPLPPVYRAPPEWGALATGSRVRREGVLFERVCEEVA